MKNIEVLFEDEHLIVAFKPAKVPSQADKTGDPDLAGFLSQRVGHNVHIINRLDRPVSGITLFAKDSKTAADLSEKMSKGSFTKEYLTVLCGKPDKESALLCDYVVKDGRGNTSRVVAKEEKNAKYAELEYETLAVTEDSEFGTLSLVKVKLLTGRHHQIRVQFAHRGTPIWGDTKYNPKFQRTRKQIELALCSSAIKFVHPATGESIEFEISGKGEAFDKFG
ncbi:MAG: RluA family pseudouridine synthase [Firmicutes bacterium]|nr:RluA family pseudouridine synthase [Bacillota bacterium]